MTKTAEQILKATVAGQAVIPYVAPIETAEVDEIKSALEIAQENFINVNQKQDETAEIFKKVDFKLDEVKKEIAAIEKEIRKTEGSYKRSSKRETLKKLYNHMVALREYLETLEDKKNFLNAARVQAIKNSFKLEEEYKMAKKAVTMAAKQEGFKYIVFAGSLKDNGGTSSNNGYTKTIAEAVSIIYHKARVHQVWHIDTIDGERIAGGVSLNANEFSALIDKYDEKYIDAEFAPVSEKVEYTPATIEEEFNYIEVKAIHNFTLGNYTESIEEMKKFVSKASGDLKKLALSELNEWIRIARAEGVEVEDFNFEETQNGWEIEKDSATTYDWTYYKKYPVEGYGAVEIKHAENTEVYSVSCRCGEWGKTLEFFINGIANTNDILLFVIKADGFRNTHGGEVPMGGGHYDATFLKGTEEENKAAAFAYADYLVEFLSHFEKTEEGYNLNQEYLREYIYGDSSETSKTDEEPKEKNSTEENIQTDNKTDEKAANLPDNELNCSEGTNSSKDNGERLKNDLNANQAKFEIGKCYAYEVKASGYSGCYEVYKVLKRRENKMSTSVTLQEYLFVDTEGNEHEMRGDTETFKISICLKSFEEIKIDKKKYLWAVNIYSVDETATNEIPAEEKNSDDENEFATGTEKQIEPIKDSFYTDNEDAARELVKPFDNYYDVKIEVIHFENNLIGFSGNLIARKGEFKALYLSNRWRHRHTIIYNAKIVSNAEVTKKFTQKQIEGIAKYHGLKLKTPEVLAKTEYAYRIEIEVENDGEPVRRETKYAKTFSEAISICKITNAKLTTYHIEKNDNVREWMAEVAEDKFKCA